MPENVEHYLNRAAAAFQKRSFDEALRLYARVIEIEPGNATALHNLGVISDVRGDLAAAERHYRLALANQPGNTATRRNLASLLLDRGAHNESRALYRDLIAADPNDGDAHFAYSRLTRYLSDDPTLGALDAALAQSANLPSGIRIKLYFATGKARHDLGDYAAAFEAFRTGNALQYAEQPYDEASNFAMLDDVRQCFDAEFVSDAIPSGVSDDMPIFVLGMPRSGSTLVEQILASHGDVTSAGEVNYLMQCVQEHLVRDRGTFSNAMPLWTPEALRDTALDYLDRLRRHAGGARRVIDKLPGNFALIGLIVRLFPNAGIVHTTRDPMAVLWSNYSTHFANRLRFTYDLDVLSRYIRQYRRTIAHWDTVLPASTVFDIRYERLVQEPEVAIRQLLDALGLGWDPACLDFHGTPRVVKTASVAQVRQPLYATAVDQWRHYRAWLRRYEIELAGQNETSRVTPLVRGGA